MIRILMLLTCLALVPDKVPDAPTEAPAPAEPAIVRGGTPQEGSPAAEGTPSEGAVEVFRYTFENNEDRNFDRHPDGWIRRKGPDFPGYVEASIDRERGHGGKGQSLCFKANGGRAILYSKPIVVDPCHAYIFRGFVRTQMLENDAALVSVSLLNHKRQRVQRFLTRPVTGTFKDWCEVTIGPIVPHEDVHFVVVGCHLVHGGRMDIRGAAWFDDLWMGEIPLFSLESNFQSQFRGHDSPIVITSHVDGLDPKRNYRLDLQMNDAEGKSVATTSFELSSKRSGSPTPDGTEPASNAKTAIPEDRPKKGKPIDWKLDPQPHGFYAVTAVLSQDGVPLLTKRTSLTVMDSLSDAVEFGEFGWTIKQTDDMSALKELAEVVAQAGVNWLKFPLWNSVSDGTSTPPAQISVFFEDLTQRRITPVGLLNDPPNELRRQFSRDWTGISELFSMRTEFWRESIEKVIARYSSHVRYWQLGQEGDESFVGMSGKNLSETITRVKSEFDRIGRDTRIGVPWNWETPHPKREDGRGIFLSMGTNRRFKENELVKRLKATNGEAPERWVLIRPLPRTGFGAEERGSDLVKRMVEAKLGGAERIFADNVFDEETGLLNPGGAPSLLFLPWRTTALALRGAEFIGSFSLSERSSNYAFSRKGDVAVVIWNHEPVDEDLFLSDESIVTDVLGRRIRLPTAPPGERPKLRVGPSPLVIRHFPEPIARWMAAVSFEKGRLPSKIGKQRDSIRGLNTFRQGASGQLRITAPKDWHVDPPDLRFSLGAGDAFVWPITLELPSNTSLGNQRIALDFNVPPYAFRVYRDYEVGLGDVVLSVLDSRLENGDLQIKQLIDNHTKPAERLNFDCNLYIPNRRRMQRTVTKLSEGRDTQIYRVSDADSLRGTELQLRAQQVGGQRVLNLRFKVGESWNANSAQGAAANRPIPEMGTPTDRPTTPAASERKRIRGSNDNSST